MLWSSSNRERGPRLAATAAMSFVALACAGPTSPADRTTASAEPVARRVEPPRPPEAESEPSAPEAEPEPSEPAETALEPERRELVVADGRALGCGVLPVVRRRVIRRSRDVAADAFWASGERRVPVRVVRRLEPRVRSLYVGTHDGMCAPGRGAGVQVGAGPDFAEVGETLDASCPRMSALAWFDCEPPSWLRYERLAYQITRLPRSGASDDPRVSASLPSEAAMSARMAEWNEEPPTDWRRQLRRRARIAEVTLERESFAVVETHWQIGDGECPIEGVTRDAFVRPAGERDWTRAEGVAGLPVGVYHDGSDALAVEVLGHTDPRTTGSDERGRCGDVEAADCEAIGIHPRASGTSFAHGISVRYGFTPGQYERYNDSHPLLRSDPDCSR